MFMDLKDEIHRLKLECVGGSCSIDDPECEDFWHKKRTLAILVESFLI